MCVCVCVFVSECVCVCVIFVTIMYINVLCFYLNLNEYKSNKSVICNMALALSEWTNTLSAQQPNVLRG